MKESEIPARNWLEWGADGGTGLDCLLSYDPVLEKEIPGAPRIRGL
jgi:hypothetical protein